MTSPMPPFLDFVLDILGPWRSVTARRMFSGHGLFHAGVMFGLVSRGQLYLKVDEESRPLFEAAGLAPFAFESQGRRVALSYHLAPEAMLDEPELAREWAERGWQAALRAHLRKKARQEALPQPRAQGAGPRKPSLKTPRHSPDLAPPKAASTSPSRKSPSKADAQSARKTPRPASVEAPPESSQ